MKNFLFKGLIPAALVGFLCAIVGIISRGASDAQKMGLSASVLAVRYFMTGLILYAAVALYFRFRSRKK